MHVLRNPNLGNGTIRPGTQVSIERSHSCDLSHIFIFQHSTLQGLKTHSKDNRPQCKHDTHFHCAIPFSQLIRAGDDLSKV